MGCAEAVSVYSSSEESLMHIIASFGGFLSFPFFFFFEKCFKSRFVIYIKEFFQVLTSQANIRCLECGEMRISCIFEFRIAMS